MITLSLEKLIFRLTIPAIGCFAINLRQVVSPSFGHSAFAHCYPIATVHSNIKERVLLLI